MENEINPDGLAKPIAHRPVVAAQLLGISKSHLERMTRAGEVPYALLGGIRVYSDDVLREWIIEKTADVSKKDSTK